MPPDPIIKDFNVACDVIDRLLSGFIAFVVNQLILQATPKTLHWRVIPAIAFTAHGGHEPCIASYGLIVFRAILAASIGV